MIFRVETMKYKIVCRYYGRADLLGLKRKPVEVKVNSKNIIIVPFPAFNFETNDVIGIYELVPIEEDK